VPKKKWQPFIATAMSAAKWLVLRPAELKTTAVSMPLTMDSHGGSGQRYAVITVEEPQELTTAAVLSSLPSIGVMLDNGRTENRRGVAHARLPEKFVQNCDATVVMGHRVGLTRTKLGGLVIEANHPMRGMLSFQDGMTQGLVQGEQWWGTAG